MGQSGGRVEPLLLVWPRAEYRAGDRMLVDGKPAVVRRVLMDTGTVLRAEVEVYDTLDAREEAIRRGR